MDCTQKQRIISFCTGYGGVELGLKIAGEAIQPVAYVEIEAFAIANLVAKIEAGQMAAAPIWPDVKTFPCHSFYRKVHGVIAGYPCQPFSAAGKQKGVRDPRHLWPSIHWNIKRIRPVWCFFENVAGHVQIGLEQVIEDLHQLGYAVEAGLFSASEAGAPHQRKRLFIMAYDQRFGHRGRFGKSFFQRQEIQAKERKDRDGLRSQTQGRSGTVANSQSEGLQNSQQGGDEPSQSGSTDRSKVWPWPARPLQEQYDWEEPRTIEPELGRATDGSGDWLDATANRVDRLRLLGNGCVPQQVALAWQLLKQRHYNNLNRIKKGDYKWKIGS